MSTLITYLLIYTFCVAILGVTLNTYTLVSGKKRKLVLRLDRACNAGVVVGSTVLLITALFEIFN